MREMRDPVFAVERSRLLHFFVENNHNKLRSKRIMNEEFPQSSRPRNSLDAGVNKQ